MTSLKPELFCCFVDDCFLVTDSEEQLTALVDAFCNKNCLKFIKEKSVNQSISFLDVQVNAEGGNYVTTVFRKPKKTVIYTNIRSESTERYKENTNIAMTHRTHTICSRGTLTLSDLCFENSNLNLKFCVALFNAIWKYYAIN